MKWRFRRRRGWRQVLDTILFFIAAGVVVYFVRSLGPENVYSTPKVIDGDSFRDGQEEVRLHGIDAPEYRQMCVDVAGKDYPCGKLAARHLRQLIGAGQVTCKVIDTDRYDRTVGVCLAGETEINDAMVRAGWALSYKRHSLGYVNAEDEARENRRGIWQGRFEDPEYWREVNRAGMVAEEPGMD